MMISSNQLASSVQSSNVKWQGNVRGFHISNTNSSESIRFLMKIECLVWQCIAALLWSWLHQFLRSSIWFTQKTFHDKIKLARAYEDLALARRNYDKQASHRTFWNRFNYATVQTKNWFHYHYYNHRHILVHRVCRGAANHSRVAEGTRLNPEGVYSGVS